MILTWNKGFHHECLFLLIPKESLFNDQFSCRVFAFCQFGFNLDQSRALPERGGKVESKNLPFIHRTAQRRPNYITFEATPVDSWFGLRKKSAKYRKSHSSHRLVTGYHATMLYTSCCSLQKAVKTEISADHIHVRSKQRKFELML